MSGWVWFVIVIGLLLGVGIWVDWRRRHSAGGHLERGSGDYGGGGHSVASCGGGDGT